MTKSRVNPELKGPINLLKCLVKNSFASLFPTFCKHCPDIAKLSFLLSTKSLEVWMVSKGNCFFEGGVTNIDALTWVGGSFKCWSIGLLLILISADPKAEFKSCLKQSFSPSWKLVSGVNDSDWWYWLSLWEFTADAMGGQEVQSHSLFSLFCSSIICLNEICPGAWFWFCWVDEGLLFYT